MIWCLVYNLDMENSCCAFYCHFIWLLLKRPTTYPSLVISWKNVEITKHINTSTPRAVVAYSYGHIYIWLLACSFLRPVLWILMLDNTGHMCDSPGCTCRLERETMRRVETPDERLSSPATPLRTEGPGTGLPRPRQAANSRTLNYLRQDYEAAPSPAGVTLEPGADPRYGSDR